MIEAAPRSASWFLPILATLGFLLWSGATDARANIVYTNLAAGQVPGTACCGQGGFGIVGSVSVFVGGEAAQAAEFVPQSDFLFTDAILPLSSDGGTPAADVYLMTAGADGLPGTIIEQFSVNGLRLTSTPDPIDMFQFTSALKPLLHAETRYWLVVTAADAVSAVSWRRDSTGDQASASDLASNITNSSLAGPWQFGTLAANKDRPAFQIDGTPFTGCPTTVNLSVGNPPLFDLGTSMNATLTASNGLTLDEQAAACGFIGFNWRQTINAWPAPSNPSACNFGSLPPFNCLVANLDPSVALQTPPSFTDPVDGGFTYDPSTVGSYPFYYSQTELNGAAAGCGGTGPIETTTELHFNDCPADPLAQGQGQLMVFTTSLVAVLSGNQPGPVLDTWIWASNFNGTANGSVAANNPTPVDPGSGTGGVVIQSVNGARQTPPSVSCSTNLNTLWPPNGNAIPVTVSGTISPGSTPLTTTAYIVSDEYSQDQPSGNIALEAGGGYSFTVPLIAARNGDDLNGRIYTIRVAATDSIGNLTICSAMVTVPHDQGGSGQ
jgi:hypothetical protein